MSFMDTTFDNLISIFLSVPFISTLLYLWWKGISPMVPRKNWLTLSVYCGCSFVLSFAPYTAVVHLPLASAAALEFAVYTITTPLAARIYLEEMVNIQKAAAVVFCTGGGALCVIGLFISGENARANLMLSNNVLQQENNTINDDIVESLKLTGSNYTLKTEVAPTGNSGINVLGTNEPFSEAFISHELVFGISMGILAGLASTGNTVFTKKLQAEVEDIFILAVYYNITGLLASFILMLAIELDDLYFPTDAENILYFTIHATSKLITSYTIQLAYYYCSAVLCALTL